MHCDKKFLNWLEPAVWFP